jgi:hypothetical protein
MVQLNKTAYKAAEPALRQALSADILCVIKDFVHS